MGLLSLLGFGFGLWLCFFRVFGVVFCFDFEDLFSCVWVFGVTYGLFSYLGV